MTQFPNNPDAIADEMDAQDQSYLVLDIINGLTTIIFGPTSLDNIRAYCQSEYGSDIAPVPHGGAGAFGLVSPPHSHENVDVMSIARFTEWLEENATD